MRKLAMGIAAVTAVLGAGPAWAGWWKITEGTDDTVVFADLESIRELPGIQHRRPFPVRQVWVKYDYSNVPSEKLRETVSLYNINCAAQTMAVQQRISRTPNGRVDSSRTYPDYEWSYDPFSPDSLGSSIIELICLLKLPFNPQ